MDGAKGSARRIESLDQFRGYTVAGMFLVNFLGDFNAIHPVLKHNNTYCSYADTIMPQFFFAVGFALRLTMLRRLENMGTGAAYLRVIRRCLALILVSYVLFPVDLHMRSWSDLQAKGAWPIIGHILKADLWETLAVIGITSMWILPVIAAQPAVRLAFLLGCAMLHLVMAQVFYFHFVFGKPNVLDEMLRTQGTAFDGGLLGFVTWCIPMLVGSLAYDMVRDSGEAVLRRLFLWACGLMLIGYLLSCPTTLYTVHSEAETDPRFAPTAASPVLPPMPFAAVSKRISFAEPPFFPPPPTSERLLNDWMMTKRAVTVSIMTFATGFSLFVYALFVWHCDAPFGSATSMQSWRDNPLLAYPIGAVSSVFRTLGQNPLAAYIIHEMVAHAVKPFVPHDSPLSYVLAMFAVFFSITYLLIRGLEKQGIYLRL